MIPPNDLIILIGPPGAGKTTIGRELAKLLDWDFIDTDALIEQSASMSVADIFVNEGEPSFRERERLAVRQAIIEGSTSRVVALGGGAPLDPASQTLLPRSVTVFLDVRESVGVRRTGLSGPRPLLAISPRARWRELMQQRRPIYSALAGHTVSSDTGTPVAIALQIAAILAPRSS